MQLVSTWVYFSGIFLPVLCCECPVSSEDAWLVLLAWRGQRMFRMGLCCGMQLPTWPGQAQVALRWLNELLYPQGWLRVVLASSRSMMDFFTCGLRGIILPCVTARCNPAGAHRGAGTFLCSREEPHGWAGRDNGPSQPWIYFPQTLRCFSDLPQTFVHALKSHQSHWRKTSLRERPPTVAQIMWGFKQVLTWHFSKWNAGPATHWLLLACNSSWSANNIICHGWWQGEKRGMGKKWEKKKYWIKLWKKTSFFIDSSDQTINFVCMLRNYCDIFPARARACYIKYWGRRNSLPFLSRARGCHWSRETRGLQAVPANGEGWKEFPQDALGWHAQGSIWEGFG